MTYKEALNVLHDVQGGTSVDSKVFSEAVEVIFANSRKVEHLQTEIGQLKTKIKNKNRIIRTTENHNNRLRNDNQAKKKVLEKRNAQIEDVVKLANQRGTSMTVLSFDNLKLRKALEEIAVTELHKGIKMSTIARKTLEELK